MNRVQFTKVQGLGNDFLIIEVADINQLDTPGELAERFCQRNYGAGADGIVFVARSTDGRADFASRIFNADGSEPEISGNGTRCAVAFLYFRERWHEKAIRISTVAGIKYGSLVSREGTHFEFEFAMGEPKLRSSDIPLVLDPPLPEVINFSLKMGGDIQNITCVSMGNPHCTTFWHSLDGVDIDELGSLLEYHPAFPMRTNVEFAHIISRDEIEVLFWERGVGRTLSSGTGSCGASVAAMLNGFTERQITVHTAGGKLRVHWRDDNIVLLTGSAEVIYEGLWLQE